MRPTWAGAGPVQLEWRLEVALEWLRPRWPLRVPAAVMVLEWPYRRRLLASSMEPPFQWRAAGLAAECRSPAEAPRPQNWRRMPRPGTTAAATRARDDRGR